MFPGLKINFSILLSLKNKKDIDSNHCNPVILLIPQFVEYCSIVFTCYLQYFLFDNKVEFIFYAKVSG